MTRCLLLAFEFYPITGGAGTNASNLASGLAHIGAPATILTYDFGKSFADHDACYPFQVVRLAGFPPKQRSEWFSAAARLCAWLRRNVERYDLILLTDWVSQVQVNMVVPFVRFPFACSVLGSEVNAFRDSPALKLLTYRLYDRAWGCLCISEYTRTLLLSRYPGLSASKTHHLPVPIVFPDLKSRPSQRSWMRAQLGLSDQDFVLFQLSRIVERKGHRFVLEALASMPATDRGQIRYLIGGNGPLMEPLRRSVVELGIQDSVRFLGFIPDNDLPAYYDACDVFIMPSLEAHKTVEGFGIVYLEAAMRRRVSIGSRHGAVPEVVLDGRTGLLADPLSSADLLSKIMLLRDYPELREEMAEVAEKRVREEFSCEEIARHLAKVHQMVVSGQSGSY